MVGAGLLMIGTGLVGAFLYVRRRLFTAPLFHAWCAALTPVGFIAILAGWFVTEVGRQPWTVYGVIRTAESVSPVLGPYVGLSLLAFIVVYLALFGAALYYILRLIAAGPPSAEGETVVLGTNAQVFKKALPGEES
jgi:cytochrome d ubiquinol oxidase subunit I